MAQKPSCANNPKNPNSVDQNPTRITENPTPQNKTHIPETLQSMKSMEQTR